MLQNMLTLEAPINKRFDIHNIVETTHVNSKK